MNAAGTRAPQAAGARGTRLASAGSWSLRRRGRPEESQAAAWRGGSEWPAVGAPPRWLPAPPPPRPHPATAPGLASGWLRRRRRWVALLVLGLLVAGAADGCELVPRNLRGRRASAAAASSPASAAGDSPALMTGEGRETAGDRGEVGGGGALHPSLQDPHSREGPPGARYPTALASARCRAERPGASVLAAALSRSPTLGRTPPPYPRHPAFDRASPGHSPLRP